MPSSSIHRPLRVAYLLGASLTLVGCGATGLDWVGESRLASEQRANVTSNSRSLGAPLIPASADQELPADVRPRLSRTITLGELDAAAPAAITLGAVAAPGVSVTVNNYNSVNAAPAYGYAPIAYTRFAPSFSAGSAPPSRGSGPQAGQDWPAITDHGSSFPYRSVPASPWQRTR